MYHLLRGDQFYFWAIKLFSIYHFFYCVDLFYFLFYFIFFILFFLFFSFSFYFFLLQINNETNKYPSFQEEGRLCKLLLNLLHYEKDKIRNIKTIIFNTTITTTNMFFFQKGEPPDD